MNTKEAELVQAVIVYAIRCANEGDTLALRHMQFGEKEIEELRKLRVADLDRVATLHNHCLDISLNRQVYWSLMDHLKRQRESEELMNSMLESDAPFEMMRSLFGLTSKEYTRLRRPYARGVGIGRPNEVDQKSADTLWDVWTEILGDRDPSELLPEEYQRMHEESGVSLRGVWRLTQTWADYGDVGVTRRTSAA